MNRSSTWSPLSNVTVNLKSSKDYQKFLVLMYCFLAVALFQSNFYGMVDVVLMLALGVYFVFLGRLKTPGAACVQIQYIEQKWQITDTKHQIEIYQTVRVRFDFGWLMWLVFQNIAEQGQHSRKHVLLFQDQITSNERHLLRVLLRMVS
ncbi:MAG: hypothetical protein P1U61_04030 [Legionellaceae bacterium]|nr:hypothetical protein [Legionellaceae bacterium]